MSEPSSGKEPTCREIIDFVMAYCDGELPAAELAIFETHLKICSPCVGYLETYRATIVLGRQAYAAEPPQPIPDDLVKAIVAARKKK